MTPDELAIIIAASIGRHQTRGLVDPAAGMDDVVIHGRVNLRLAAQDVLGAMARSATRRSWSPWFTGKCETRRSARRQVQRRIDLAGQLDEGLSVVDAAIARMRIRKDAKPSDD